MAEAVRWYEEQSPGLGAEYLRAVEIGIASAGRHPLIYAAVYRSVRRILLRRFPFALFFVVKDDAVVILACLHGKRHPDRLKSRVRKVSIK